MLLTHEQRLFTAAINDLATRECGERAQRDALTDNGATRHNSDLYLTIAGLGWLGAAIPEEYGGNGGGMRDLCLLLEELSYGRIPAAGLVVTSIVSAAYKRFGTEEQKQDILGGIVRGEVEAIAMSETEAGSDVAALRTRAIRDRDDYVINGQKTWISEADVSRGILLVCRTATNGDKHEGLTMIRVPTQSDGITIRGINTLGGRIVNDVFLNDVRVPASNVLGTVGHGWTQLMAGLNAERLVLAAQSLGTARRALDDTVEYVKQRRQFGRPIGTFQAIRHRIADLAMELECSRLLTYEVAALVDGSPDGMHPRDASMAKLKASETAKQIAVSGLQMMGAQGYAAEGNWRAMSARPWAEPSTEEQAKYNVKL